jgi:Protein of unknown function (DUF1501)
MTRSPIHCPGPVSRRSFLKAGALGLGGFGLSDLLRVRSAAAASGRPAPDTSLIFVWLPGGPPHTETYDMKPQAPSDYRGIFNPIATNVPGLDVCEYMPLHARLAHKYNIIRSVCHKFADHGGGHKRFMTGRIPKTPTEFVNDAPSVTSIVARMREHVDIGLPNCIAGTNNGRDGVDVFSMGAAYLGPAYQPFIFPGDPSDPKFQIRNLELSATTENRIDDRLTLLRDFDRLRHDVDESGMMDAMDGFNQRAVSLLTSSNARSAFDLSQESESLKGRYGRHAWGYRALMARRLVEAGCSMVTMVLENPYVSGIPHPKDGVYNWDSHAVNCHMFNDLRNRLPIYDRAVTALVEDIYDRGLDEKVLVVVTGEFGRTPRISNQIGTQTGTMQPGRDHWPGAMSMLVCGGGMRTGQVIGSTNSKAEGPQDRPLTPNDLWATVYRHLGIDTQHSFPDHFGRPMPILPFGEPIAELL